MNITFAHLQTELARIDLLIHRRVAAMERMARTAVAVEVNGASLHMSIDEALRILQQPFGEPPTSDDAEQDEAYYAAALGKLETQIAALVSESDETEEESRLVRLASICGLTRFDLDCFLIAMAPAIDLRYERLFGYLHDDLTRRRATANLMLDLLAPAGPQRLLYFERFGEDAPLMHHRLLEAVAEPGVIQPVALNQGVAANPTIVTWLLGNYHPDASLQEYVTYRSEPLAPDRSLGRMLSPSAVSSVGGDDAAVADQNDAEPAPEMHEASPAHALPRTVRSPALLGLTETQHAVIRRAAESDAFLVLVGKDRSTQTTAQRLFATLVGTPLLTLDMRAAVRATGVPHHGGAQPDGGVELRSELRDLLALFLRDAGLIHATAAVTGWDAVLEDGAPPAQLLALLNDYVGPVTVASETQWRSRAVVRARRFTWLELPIPDYAQRREMLGEMLRERLQEPWTLAQGKAQESVRDRSLAAGDPVRPGSSDEDSMPVEADAGAAHPGQLPPAASQGEAIDVVGLAGRYRLTGEQMEDMLATALDRAGQGERALRNADLFAAARDHSSPRLASLARKLTLRYDWDDLILPDDQVDRLHELVGMVQGRAQVLDEWGLLRKLAPSYGVTALFAGSPGTGKTMAAEVIAKALALDVFKIDLSGMISKYIGETEKNLEKVFNEAENTSAILFFDEADAIFGKRSEVKDAHDRYANIETSYLLQRMEAYDGVTILSTNLRANLDEAFTRRMNTIVDFPFPDEEQRLRIWRTLYPKQVPSAGDVDLPLLARRYKIAGGSIRNILVAAAYFASADDGVLAMRHLLHGMRRELQKLGRLTEESEFPRL